MKYIISDIDGTISNPKERLHFIQNKPKNWNAFNGGVTFDTPFLDTVAVLDSFRRSGGMIILCTGREMKYKDATTQWFQKNNIFYDDLFMRKFGDHRKDYEVKSDLLNDIIAKYGNNVVCVLEDRTQCVDMWRGRGLRCYQVASGDY